MKKYINYIKMIVFLLGFFIILEILNPIFMPKINTEDPNSSLVDAKQVYAEPNNTIDVLFVGDSNAYSSFSPITIYQKYKIKSYVTANARQLMYQTYDFIKDVNKRQNLKVVVMETNLLFGDMKASRAVSYELKKYFGFINYHDRWKTLSTEDFNFSQTQEKNLIKGFKYSLKTHKNKDKPNYMNTNGDKSIISSTNEYYLETIKKYCNNHNIELILVSAPNYKLMNYNRKNQLLDLTKKFNITYIDYNEGNPLNINWETDSRDKGDHLNVKGAKKVSLAIGEYIMNNIDNIDYNDNINWDKDLEKIKQEYPILLEEE